MPSRTSGTPNLNRGYAVALASAAILSTTAILIRYLTHTFHLPALVLAFWRDLLAALTMVVVLGVLRSPLLRAAPRHLRYLILYGFVLAVFNSLWTLSVALNGAAIATVLVYCSTGFTALLGWWLLAERPDWARLVAIVLSLGGCGLVTQVVDPQAWSVNLSGGMIGISSGLLFAVYSLMGRSASQRGLNPWTTLLYTFGFAAGFLLLFNLTPAGMLPGAASRPADFFWLGNSVAGWGLLVVLAAGPTVGGFGLYNVSLAYLPSSVANLIMTLEPPFTAVIAYILLGERLNAMQAGGGLVILLGVAFLRIHEARLAGQLAPQPG
jgi:drug/metabolite transporter (DMT)-like permease